MREILDGFEAIVVIHDGGDFREFVETDIARKILRFGMEDAHHDVHCFRAEVFHFDRQRTGSSQRFTLFLAISAEH